MSCGLTNECVFPCMHTRASLFPLFSKTSSHQRNTQLLLQRFLAGGLLDKEERAGQFVVTCRKIHCNQNCHCPFSILPKDRNYELSEETVVPLHKIGNVRNKSRCFSLGENQFAFRHQQFAERLCVCVGWRGGEGRQHSIQRQKQICSSEKCLAQRCNVWGQKPKVQAMGTMSLWEKSAS